MKTLLAVLCLASLTAFADENEIRLQQKRVSDRQQELKDAQDFGNPVKESFKQQRLDEEKAELQRLKDEQEKNN